MNWGKASVLVMTAWRSDVYLLPPICHMHQLVPSLWEQRIHCIIFLNFVLHVGEPHVREGCQIEYMQDKDQ
jgi:hypothetical protein